MLCTIMIITELYLITALSIAFLVKDGCGKSYGAKKYVIQQYNKKHSQFLYLRRYDNEIKEIFEKTNGQKDFFDDIKDEFPKNKLEAKNRKFYIDGECFGYAKRLTEAQDLKSSVYQNVKIIIIDEYPIENTRHRHYLPNEAMVILGIIDSIIRNRSDIKIFILGNAVEGLEYSPLFSFFNLSLPYNNDIKLFKDNLILVQYMNNEEFRKDRENTLIGKLAKGTDYEKYAMQNKILDKNKNFIEKKKGSSKFSFAFVYNDITYGVWNDYHEGKIFVSFDFDKYSPFIFSMTLKDHSPNTLMFNTIKKYNFWKNFIENFKLGNVYFENQKIKHNVYELIKMFHNR